MLLILAQVQFIGPCAQKLESGIQSFSCQLDDGKISICAACGKSGRHQSHFVAEYLNFRLREPSQMLSASGNLGDLGRLLPTEGSYKSQRLWNPIYRYKVHTG